MKAHTSTLLSAGDMFVITQPLTVEHRGMAVDGSRVSAVVCGSTAEAEDVPALFSSPMFATEKLASLCSPIANLSVQRRLESSRTMGKLVLSL